MKRITIMAVVASALGVGACAMGARDSASAGTPSAGASAEIHDASGRVVGTATASQTGDRISIRVEGTAMSPGPHGAHVHTTGTCTPPDFASAGPHWNPTAHQHGKDNPAGMHMGDLPNLLIGADGRGTIEYSVPDASIGGGTNALLDGDGAAIVIHAQPDDYRTDPSGNSGGRIACGVFR